MTLRSYYICLHVLLSSSPTTLVYNGAAQAHPTYHLCACPPHRADAMDTSTHTFHFSERLLDSYLLQGSVFKTKEEHEEPDTT